MGDARAIICPLCKKSIKFDSGLTDENEKVRKKKQTNKRQSDNLCQWNAHYITDCTPENYAKATSGSKKCKVKGCKENLTTLNTHMCKTCKQELCLKYVKAL